MARESQDRENLLRDATAFVTRVQLRVPIAGVDSEVFVGFRANGAVSYYFDQDPVYHFNQHGELRRAFSAGVLIKADQGYLATWQRQHRQGEVAMLRQDMSATEQNEFCVTAKQRLAELLQALTTNSYTLAGQVPESCDPIRQVIAWLEQQQQIQVAKAPNLVG